MSIVRVLLLATLLAGQPANARSDRPSLDHDDYDRWSRIENERISSRGGWVVYRLVPERGEPRLVVQRSQSKTRYVIPRGKGGRVDDQEEWLVCRIDPDTSSGEEGPRLGLLRLADGRLTEVEQVESFALSSRTVAWLHASSEGSARAGIPRSDASGLYTPGPDTPGPDTPGDDEKDGGRLILQDLQTGEQQEFDHVRSYLFSGRGRWLALVEAGEQPGLRLVPTDGSEPVVVATGDALYRRLVFSDDEQSLAFLSAPRISEDPSPVWSLQLWSEGDAGVQLAGPASRGLPSGWHISEHRQPQFSDSADRVYFGTAPNQPPADRLSPMEEDVVLDVWSWTDEVIQPRQLVNLSKEQTRSFLAVARAGWPDSVVQLGDEEVPTVRLSATRDAQWALGVTDRPYRGSYGWDQQLRRDAYLIDTRTGERTRVLEGVQGSPRLSPAAKYLWWWDGAQRAWFVLDVEASEADGPRNISAAIGERVDRELHDQPALPGPYGAAGWLEGDEGLVLYDAYDLWLVTPEAPESPRCLTQGIGRDRRLRFRYVDEDPAPALSASGRLLLSTLDETSKRAGFWEARLDPRRPPRELWMAARRTTRPVKADSADVLLMRSGSFRIFNDLWVSDTNLRHRRQVSDANPQTAEYRWGSAELVQWQSMDGSPLRGILYKPDDFDPDTQYPMITYFYERNSDYLHQHHPPTPHRSIIRFPFYTSRGYLVFVPDIEYHIGAPGPSAVSAIVPGVLKLIDQGFVDPDAIGLQGHSWGGYQAAFLITQTDLFACAVAGAVVSNMTSAYGGIRWATGVSRMYKYEKTQSRIGGTLWQETHRYLDNSPLFFADQVNTPLLMMHNDEDGAVPWYQGIEYFLALRRLSRPVWMLNYNGQPHWVTTKATQRDYARRMQQFFDHYLKGDPAPMWMVEGIPAIRKGRTLGLELSD